MTGTHGNTDSRIDWLLVICYLALIVMGWFSIFSATGTENGSVSDKAVMQGIWIGVSLLAAVTVLLLDSRYYYSLSYAIYWIMMGILLLTVFIGVEVNGAKSWLAIGPVRIQPAEFGKLATALAVARLMNHYRFNIKDFSSILSVGFLIGFPALLILLQNDTGSALVYGSFLFMLYREGLSRWVYLALLAIIVLFLLSFFITPFALTSLILIITAVIISIYYRNWKTPVRYLTIIYGLYGLTTLIMLLSGAEPSGIKILLIIFGISVPIILIYSLRMNMRQLAFGIVTVIAALTFLLSVDYVFENMMQLHQQKRILNLLGIEKDVMGWGYNVNQSKIAIGSGGFIGKGFMEGTQTKYNFVPEHSTDFIFCTVGEEFGFLGSFTVLGIFFIFIARLIIMADKQQDTFNRVFCLSVASIFLFHVIVNIGMTIGLMPVIGIPLPFFSYGGSSLLSFTLLTFIAIRLNMENRN